MVMLFLLLKLLSVALISFLIIPIYFSTAVYFSLDRSLMLVGLNVFGFNALRLNIALEEKGISVLMNGKETKSTKKIDISKLLAKITIFKISDIKLAMQYGAQEINDTAMNVQTIKIALAVIKGKYPFSEYKVFTDWKREVLNVGLRLDMSVNILNLLDSGSNEIFTDLAKGVKIEQTN